MAEKPKTSDNGSKSGPTFEFIADLSEKVVLFPPGVSRLAENGLPV
jgi:hypothetical protein